MHATNVTYCLDRSTVPIVGSLQDHALSAQTTYSGNKSTLLESLRKWSRNSSPALVTTGFYLGEVAYIIQFSRPKKKKKWELKSFQNARYVIPHGVGKVRIDKPSYLCLLLPNRIIECPVY